MSASIENMLKYINLKDLSLIKKELSKKDKVLVVELDGTKIQSWIDYIIEIQSKFRFPSSCIDSIDRYLDWIRDLGWLEHEEFIIIINNFNEFCKKNPSTKKEIILDFEETILPYWQDEVKDVVVGGIPKSFKMYLVD